MQISLTKMKGTVVGILAVDPTSPFIEVRPYYNDVVGRTVRPNGGVMVWDRWKIWKNLLGGDDLYGLTPVKESFRGER